MSIRKLMTQPILVQPVAITIDQYGSSVEGPAGAPVPERGYLELTSSVEYLVSRDTIVTRWKAFLFPESVVTQWATLTIGGQRFRVEGAPWQVFNPRLQRVSHIECVLTEVS